jgi:DNA replication protein DnaC
LGLAACEQGHRVHFYTAAGLINALLEAEQTHRLTRLESWLMKQDLIILDEVGFVPFSQRGAQMLFTFISQKYLRGSLIITSNLTFAEWTEVFGDARLTSALLDRLTHRCHILEFSGDSYRFRQSLQRQAGMLVAPSPEASSASEGVPLP